MNAVERILSQRLEALERRMRVLEGEAEAREVESPNQKVSDINPGDYFGFQHSVYRKIDGGEYLSDKWEWALNADHIVEQFAENEIVCLLADKCHGCDKNPMDCTCNDDNDWDNEMSRKLDYQKGEKNVKGKS